MSIPARQLIAPLALAAGVLALSAPALSLAGEGAVTTTVVPAPEPPAVTTTVAPSPEGPADSPAATPPPSTQGSEPLASTTPEASAPKVQSQLSQSSSPAASSTGSTKHAHSNPGAPPGAASGEAPPASALRAKQRALSPSALTPSLPFALESSISGIPSFFIESFRIPPFLLPIYQAAGTSYDIPWQVLAAINEVETDYGRDVSVSSAGAEGWMQFLPAEWAQYGVDANGDGFKDPYNPADAIFAAARYLRAAGGASNIRAGVFSYNHSQAYVESVMLRAQLLGGTPPELLGAITALTEAHFPVHAAAHFSDGFLTAPAGVGGGPGTLVGTTIDTQVGAPVVAVQDGEIVKVGRSAALGRYVVLRDAFGNSYVYAQLGEVSSVYPVLAPHAHSTVSTRITPSGRPEPAPSGPATAGAQPRSPVSEGAAVTGLALGAAAGLEAPPAAPAATPSSGSSPAPSARASKLSVFREGANDVYLQSLRAGAQVIAGTVLGHVGAVGTGPGGQVQPHIFFQIRPAGAGAPLIDPKPVLDGWVALENTSIFRAKGENPFLATSPSAGQVLLESKQQLEPQVLHDGGVKLGRCGRAEVQSGRVDKRVLAALEYLAVSGLKPTVGGVRCAAVASATLANAPAAAEQLAVSITAINGIPIAGHQGQGSIADTTVRKLLMLQGISRPRRIASLQSYPGTPVALADPSAGSAIGVAFSTPSAHATRAPGGVDSSLSPSQWIQLTSRLGEIPDPTVGRGPSPAAIPDAPVLATERGNGGHG